MKKNWIKIGIIVLSVIIVIVLLLILFKSISNNKKANGNGVSEQQNHDESFIQIQEEKQVVNDETLFFTVEKCVQFYLDASSYNLSNTQSNSRTINAYFFKNENDKKDALLKLLSEDYIKKNNITADNVQKYTHFVNEKLSFTAKKMYNVQYGSLKKVSVYGKLTNGYYTNPRDSYFIVTIDQANITFSIEPVVLNNGQMVEDIELTNRTEKIEKNGKNTFVYDRVGDKEVAEKYLAHYKKIALANSSEAYEYLDDEYKKSFGSLEKYAKYVDENRKDIANIFVKDVEVTIDKDGTKIYKITDTKGKKHTIKASAVMQYKIN